MEGFLPLLPGVKLSGQVAKYGGRCERGFPIALCLAMRKDAKRAGGGDVPPQAAKPKSERAQDHASGAGPAVILIAPQLGGNIGAAARAMANFGLFDLKLVSPRDGWPNEVARANAAGADWVIEATRVYDTAQEALADLNFVCATTARSRDMVKPVLTPEAAAREMRSRIAAGQACGMLFGAEKSGLSNDDVALADAIVTAPVNPTFASLNLAQAVLIMSYEWLKAAGTDELGRRTAFDGPARPGLRLKDTRPAERGELIGFFEHLEAELDTAGFLRPLEKRPAMVRGIRNMFLRLGATDQDVRTLRGIVAALARGRGMASQKS